MLRPAGVLLVVVVVSLALVVGCGGGGSGVAPGRGVSTAGTTSKIAFTRYVPQGRGGYQRKLFTINPDGTGVTEVAGNGSQQAAWSPDGSKIAYSCSGRIYTMDASGAGKTAITPKGNDQYPAWSPDGTKIAFQRVSGIATVGIYTVPATGGAATLVAGSKPGDQYPCWSPDPDGKFLLFEGSQRQNGGTEAIGLYTLPSAGGVATLLLDTYDGLKPYGYSYISYSDWTDTPTNRIIYRIYTNGNYYIYCVGVQVSGSSVTTVGEPFPLGLGEHPSWSSTGTQATMSLLNGCGIVIRDVPPDGTGIYTVVPYGQSQGIDPDWSP